MCGGLAGRLIVTIVVRRRGNNSLVATGLTTDAKGITDYSTTYFAGNNGGHFSTISRTNRENPLSVFFQDQVQITPYILPTLVNKTSIGIGSTILMLLGTKSCVNTSVTKDDLIDHFQNQTSFTL